MRRPRSSAAVDSPRTALELYIGAGYSDRIVALMEESVMRLSCVSRLLVLAWAVSGHGFARGMDAEAVAADEATLRAAKMDTDGAALLGFFRKHTLTDADRARIDLLIKQ